MTASSVAYNPPRALGVTAAVLGIVGLLLAVLPVLGIPLGAIGLVFGLAGFVLALGRWGTFGWPVAGIALAGLALALGMAVAWAPAQYLPTGGPLPETQPAPEPRYIPPPARPGGVVGHAFPLPTANREHLFAEVSDTMQRIVP